MLINREGSFGHLKGKPKGGPNIFGTSHRDGLGMGL
jgi:hypothetical protein